jgi:hypothetical protein
MDKRNMFISALVGALVMVVLTQVPFLNLINCLICAGLWIGGIVAVWFYRRQTGQLVTGGQGALLGALAGLIGAVLGAIIGAIFGGALLSTMIASDPTGTAEEALGGFVGAGATAMVGFLFNIIVFPLFGAIGGAAYAVIAKPPASKTPM